MHFQNTGALHLVVVIGAMDSFYLMSENSRMIYKLRPKRFAKKPFELKLLFKVWLGKLASEDFI